MQTHNRRPSDKAEEALEALWVEIVEGKQTALPATSPALAEISDGLGELYDLELARVQGGAVQLTPRGHDLAKETVRRHRLAECLLSNVLEVEHDQMDVAACGIEHSLRAGVDEAVCSLLGHPDHCPHGKPIPRGECCETALDHATRAVAPLRNLRPGQRGRIAYVQTTEARKLQKLMAMGVLPGKTLRLIQGFPSFVFEVGHSQFAVDADMAGTIFVRAEEASARA